MSSDALLVGGGVTSPPEARLASSGLLALQGPTALDVRTGVFTGPGSQTLLTGTTDTGPMTVQIGVHVAVTSRGNANGPYIGPTLEAPVKVTIAAAPATGSRIDVVYVKQQDGNSGVPSPDVTTAPLYAVLQGVAGSSPSKPDLSTIVGATELGTVQVAAGATSTSGSGVTITNTARQTTTRGGLLLCANRTERLALTTYATLQALELDKGYRLWHDGIKWRYAGDLAIVASTTERDALDAYVGLKALDSSTGKTWQYIAGSPGSWIIAGHVADVADTEVTYATGWARYTDATIGWNGLRYWRIGDVVTVSGAFQTTAATGAQSIITTLPAGLRPTSVIDLRTAYNLRPDGTIRANAAKASGAVDSFATSFSVAP